MDAEEWAFNGGGGDSCVGFFRRDRIKTEGTRVIVIGAGAAGMMASCAAAQGGARVLLLEKNEKTGKKIYITGKGRCNFTNLCDTEDFFSNVPRNARFLYSSVYGFDPHAVRDWFEERGVRTKEERGLTSISRQRPCL